MADCPECQNNKALAQSYKAQLQVMEFLHSGCQEYIDDLRKEIAELKKPSVWERIKKAVGK